jgi:hypothetical protein
VDFKNSEKMMRKDFLAGGEVQVQNIRKNDEKRRFRSGEVQVQNIRKNDEKRRFKRWRTSKLKKSEKMRIDVSGGGEVQVREIR